ncbi:cyanoexosortase A, partial [Sphaerothrix gracilis]|uniref:cyanoexosortase A n=1 Tax=Sphaerothrix gracilis TaxID=3151835 RepID=UPI0031FC111C
MAQTAPRSIRIPQFGLLALAALLTAIYFAVISHAGDTAHLGMSGLFYLAAASLVWDKRQSLPNQTSLQGIVLGSLLLILTLALSAYLLQLDFAIVKVAKSKTTLTGLRLLPFLSGLALAALAAGVRGFRLFWRELVILFFLGAPSVVAAFVTDISPATARFSTFLLWYSGFDVMRQGLVIALPGGGVEVYYGCSGMESITYLLGLSAVCLVMFPISGIKRWLTPFIAIAIGFFINAIRVALMAVLAASENKAAFDYWHEGDGSLLFGLVAVLFFGGLYMLI